MNEVLLHNRAVLSANTGYSSTEQLELRIARLEAMLFSPFSGVVRQAHKPTVVKTYPKLDVEPMQKEAIAKAEKTAANIRSAEKKILAQVSGRAA